MIKVGAMECVPNPIFGPNKFKLGLFNANCDGGFTLSKAPERWRCEWDDVVTACVMADEAGIDFILPVAKWRGLAGEADNLGRSFETMTHSAAIGALTKRIGLFATVHVPLATPAFVAKCIATIDHVTHGRAGLNIVCGWNQDEFNVHGVTIDPERRYDQGLEWFRIYAKILEGGAPFDWDGEFYHLRGVVTDPLSLQRPRPPVMSAAVSGAGRQFAAQSADILFTVLPDLERAPPVVAGVQQDAAQQGRHTDVYIQTQIVCRPRRQDAEDYYYYFAEEHADQDALDYFRRQRLATLTKGSTAGELPYSRVPMNRFTQASGKSYSGMFPGMYPV